MDAHGDTDALDAGRRERIRANYEAVLERIAAAAARAKRDPAGVTLVAVTKAVSLAETRYLCELGATHLGENRLNVAAPKIEALGSAAHWHMIGPIQRRKAKDVVSLFNRVDAIDRIVAAEALERRCGEEDKRIEALVEVNVSGEDSKHGFTPDALGDALKRLFTLEHIEVKGLMTMAPFVADPEETRPVFRKLRTLAERHGLAVVSMGMTNDFEVAVEEGATEVRVGSALFA